mmetsp:Transcript_49046/g.140981  ORF Transcript_49046/g.140981 Transcript_49046/m.140981 type:complete len:323 (+) Transcript_49046:478-1446(+)
MHCGGLQGVRDRRHRHLQDLQPRLQPLRREVPQRLLLRVDRGGFGRRGRSGGSDRLVRGLGPQADHERRSSRACPALAVARQVAQAEGGGRGARAVAAHHKLDPGGRRGPRHGLELQLSGRHRRLGVGHGYQLAAARTHGRPRVPHARPAACDEREAELRSGRVRLRDAAPPLHGEDLLPRLRLRLQLCLLHRTRRAPPAAVPEDGRDLPHLQGLYCAVDGLAACAGQGASRGRVEGGCHEQDWPRGCRGLGVLGLRRCGGRHHGELGGRPRPAQGRSRHGRGPGRAAGGRRGESSRTVLGLPNGGGQGLRLREEGHLVAGR